MKKYNISEQFKKYANFKPPINSLMIRLVQKIMKPPKTLFKDNELSVNKIKIPSYKNSHIEIYEISPKTLKENAPCLVYFHGGGFVLEGANHHYDLCRIYAKGANCKVIYVKYRLAPKYKFPYFTEDCFAAYKWVINNAQKLQIDPNNVGVGGDSAGGNLAAGVCIIAKERNICMPKFQMLIYPFLDGSLQSESNKKYTDTPMWNSKLSKKVQPMLMPKGNIKNLHHISPFMTPSLKGVAPAYIETAEFDSLHDDGITYSKHLIVSDVEVDLNQTKQTMHGFDIVIDADITKQAIKRRLAFMKKYFSKDKVAESY